MDHLRTPHTADGRLRYDLDPNARYESRDTLMRLLDRADSIYIPEWDVYAAIRLVPAGPPRPRLHS